MCSLPARQQLDSFSICRDPLACIAFHMFCIFLLSCHSQHLVTLHSSFYMDSLCPFNHLYVSRVKFYNFLYPLSIMTKRERKCGFFLRFYMLGGEIHAFVRGSCVSSCQGECLPDYCFRSFFQLLVYRSCDHLYIHCAYLKYIYIYMMYVFFTYLYIYNDICMQSLFLFHT